MPLERLKSARQRTVGTKQTLKAVEKGQAKQVFVAVDADPYVINPLMKLCEEKAIPVVNVDTMEALGQACHIKVGCASAAIMAE
ncbi:50S ribosomal protein L7Ae-like protein [Heliobacillus mobilis]|uniref:50S ribosomal protein L7Ae-like protein n=2 Tax=Heliobacterium TaxID=2697 RepID=A0A6I3SM14_HELMO|nr:MULTISPECIES: ribosomal L7Ae/L30e/S12e/Gadd45 family protein [Heliobacterium]MBC9785247.1 ribosomal L7Ae/L30e/S12e/Gadd45 family protein [Heliobacterium chlorum]MTV49487.1 50S ribosomal protein L7Ae-like protein [Heliobacterium mobile]